MTIEVALLISAVSVIYAIYQGTKNIKRSEKQDTESGTSQLTTVIVKLENIGTGITEIKSEMGNVKNEVRDIRDRVISCEESTKQAHKRLDEIR